MTWPRGGHRGSDLITAYRTVGCIFLVILLCVAGLAAPAGATRVYIDIDQPFAKKFPVAIPDFPPLAGGAGGPADVAVGLPNRLGKNLDMTGMFIPLDKRTFLERNFRAGITGGPKISFQEWRAIGTEFLIKGAHSVSGDRLTLELRLYDVFEERMLLGKRYTAGRKDGRKIINRFTNHILYILTGEMGVFGTQIAFVSGARARKSVMLTEFGGDEVTGVAGHLGGPSTQPCMSSGNAIAYVHRNGRQWELVVGGQVISAGPLHVSPTFSPDGSILAAMSGKYATNIFRFSPAGGKPTQITRQAGINISPTVSPDGSRIAFVSTRAGNPQIYITSISGGGIQRVTAEGKNTDPNWSPRGDRIVFCHNESEIASIAPDGSDFQQLTYGQGRNTRPTWSPDGRLIAFASNRTGRSRIYIMSANGERQQVLLEDYRGGQGQPYWSPAKPDLPDNARK